MCAPIGIVRSRFRAIAGMPIQTSAAPDEVGQIELFPEFVAGLRDIGGFEYLFVLTRLHRCSEERLDVVPFLDEVARGVFATRAPARPNRIGLSIICLERVEGHVLHYRGNDLMDETPVLDIKPYVPAFDVRSTDRIGWFEGRIDRLAETRSDNRML